MLEVLLAVVSAAMTALTFAVMPARTVDLVTRMFAVMPARVSEVMFTPPTVMLAVMLAVMPAVMPAGAPAVRLVQRAMYGGLQTAGFRLACGGGNTNAGTRGQREAHRRGARGDDQGTHTAVLARWVTDCRPCGLRSPSVPRVSPPASRRHRDPSRVGRLRRLSGVLAGLRPALTITKHGLRMQTERSVPRLRHVRFSATRVSLFFWSASAMGRPERPPVQAGAQART